MRITNITINAKKNAIYNHYGTTLFTIGYKKSKI